MDYPFLRELRSPLTVALDMGHLAPEAFRCFAGHPTLRAARVRLGSTRKNQAARDLLPLPDAEYLRPAEWLTLHHGRAKTLPPRVPT